MRKMLILMMALPSLLFAQVDSSKSKVKKNEITVNAFELTLGGILPINYERFINKNQSITVKTLFFDKPYRFFNEINSNLISLQTQYNFYLSEKKKNAGFFLAPFLKFTGGKYTQLFGRYDYNGIFIPGKESRVNALISGLGIGHKFLLKNKISFSISADIGRVLNRAGYYQPVEYYQKRRLTELRIGANFGIRF